VQDESRVDSLKKRIRINSAIFSDDDDDDDEEKEEEENKEEKNRVVNNNNINQSTLLQSSALSLIQESDIQIMSPETLAKATVLLERLVARIEEIKTDSSLDRIQIICKTLDDIIDESVELPSPLLFLAFCFNEFQLSSSRLISDDQFLRLVETYVDHNLRPNHNISLFLIGVMLQRIRRLQAPASRLLMKAIDHCLTHSASDNSFNFFLCRVLTLPSTIESIPSFDSFDLLLVPPVGITVSSYQYEFVQRIIRQNSYSVHHNLNSFFSDLMTPSDSFSLLRANRNHNSSSSASMTLNQTLDSFLLDGLLNSISWPSTPFCGTYSDDLVCHLCSNHNLHKLSTSSFAITQDSLKFISSLFLSVRSSLLPLQLIVLQSIKSFSLSTLGTLIRHIEVTLNGIDSLDPFPSIATLLHSLVTKCVLPSLPLLSRFTSDSHPGLKDSCREELLCILQRTNSNAVIAQNLLKQLRTPNGL
jgi:hypothetical protein